MRRRRLHGTMEEAAHSLPRVRIKKVSVPSLEMGMVDNVYPRSPELVPGLPKLCTINVEHSFPLAHALANDQMGLFRLVCLAIDHLLEIFVGSDFIATSLPSTGRNELGFLDQRVGRAKPMRRYCDLMG